MLIIQSTIQYTLSPSSLTILTCPKILIIIIMIINDTFATDMLTERYHCVSAQPLPCESGDVGMDVWLPLAVVCALSLSAAASNATRRRPDALPDEPLLPEDEDDIGHRLDYYDEERINISGQL